MKANLWIPCRKIVLSEAHWKISLDGGKVSRLAAKTHQRYNCKSQNKIFVRKIKLHDGIILSMKSEEKLNYLVVQRQFVTRQLRLHMSLSFSSTMKTIKQQKKFLIKSDQVTLSIILIISSTHPFYLASRTI